MTESDGAGDAAVESEKFGPSGFYKIFKKTPEEIFGTEPDGKVQRQILYLETYLEVFVSILQKKRKLDIDRAKDITLAFIQNLFNSPAIRANAWGRYRYYITKAFFRFADRELKRLKKADELELSACQRLAMFVESVEDFFQDRLLNLEERQIRQAIEDGTIDDFLNRGLESGELTRMEILIWHLSADCHLTRRQIIACREIADSQTLVTADTVKNTLRKVEAYFRKHAREVRLALRNL